ncbi:class I SAM-dependent RNA methyltransferase [Roseovarius tibetensis]|uniref:class I SAM-dependent RNA methyltransferase n=1 Tax=Roseovarius tibetensis TaxID=2685897 RepID=UPI003D7FB198
MTGHRITRLGHHGDGIADGPVYAPRTLPGEVVTGVMDGQTLRDIRILDPSPDRVAPPCRHFKSCGGCQLQHAADDFVARWKAEVVETALAAHDIPARIAAVHTSPPRSRRRATLAARRTKAGAMAGFHARGSETMTEIPDCHLLHPELMAGLPLARDLARVGTSRKAPLAVTLTRSLGGLDVAVTGGKPADGPLRATLADLAGTHDIARLAWDGEMIVTRRAPEQVFGPARVVPPPGAFLQATDHGEAALLNAAETILSGSSRIVDLFAGCGTFTLPLARRAHLHAVEGDAEMLRALDAGGRHATGLKPVTTEARDLYRRPLLTDELARFDAALLDPPRAGAEAQIAQIAAAQLPRLGYISCNPVTFARDARYLLSHGYEMGPVQVVDQFRWSAHIELVAGFTLKTA